MNSFEAASEVKITRESGFCTKGPINMIHNAHTVRKPTKLKGKNNYNCVMQTFSPRTALQIYKPGEI